MMNIDTELINNENAPIHFISEKMETLQVPDNHNTLACEYFKDGKLYFNEVKLRAESHPAVAEKLKHFRAFRANLEREANINQQTIDIPAAYLDLIAALVQDSDEPFTVLSTRINDLLSPFLRNESAASKFESAVEKAIKKVSHKVNYGLTEEVYSNIEHSAPKIPWHLYISRWEVKDIQLFPMDMQQAVSIRREIRQNMTNVFSSFIQNLSPNERLPIVNTKHRKSTVAHKETEDNRHKQALETDHEKDEKRKKKEEEKKKRDEERKQHEEEKRLRDEEKRLRDEEKKALEEEKKKQREEEKRQREEEKRLREEEKKKREDEKKKKEQSQLRLTSLFAKTSIVETAPPVEKLLEPAKPTLFPAFYIKDNVTIADINHLSDSKKCSSYEDFRNSINGSNSVSVGNFLSELHDSKQKRGVSTHVDVRTLLLPGSADIMHVPNVRLVLRMKLLQFQENVRPAYYGTFTKRSHKVSGRQPFAKDEDKLDYDVDSEAEWEPEGEGEDIVSGDEDEDDPNTDMIDPEDAGWLVPEGYLSDNEGVEGEDEMSDRIMGKSSRHTNSSKRIAVRKIVLGPFFQGETEEDEVLKPFETEFFIDVSEEGFNPFYKEPVSRVTPTPASATTTTTHTTTTKVNEFTDKHRNALINVINEKSGDSIPNLITEAKTNWLLKDVSKRQLEANIKNIAVKEKRGTDTKPTWYIKETSST